MLKNITKPTVKIHALLILIFLTCTKIVAVTNYVSLSGEHVLPFASWAEASTNIQDAVDAAGLGGFVLVTNGVYVISTNIVVEYEIKLIIAP